MKQIKARPNSLIASLIILFELFLTSFAILLSTSNVWIVWIFGQLLFSITMLHWFVLMHDLGHGSFFKSKFINEVCGHVASVFAFVPFYPWKHVHHLHHVWTGWKDIDPTHPKVKLNDVSPIIIKIMNFCWKFWIPLFTISYAAFTFWNIPKLNHITPLKSKKIKQISSILLLILILLLAIYFLEEKILIIWLPAFFIYLIISDPLLLSQHTHIDHNHSGGNPVKIFPFKMQDVYTRTLIYPSWISKYFLYRFDKHGLHHQYPNIPLYELGKYDSPETNKIYWLEWLNKAKKIPASILIFQSFKDTHIKL